MAGEAFADYAVDRRKLARKARFWRVAAFAIAILAVGAVGIRLTQGGSVGAHIARITISGVITGDEATLKLLKDVREQSAASALILSIESPGGTTTGAEKLYEEIRRVAEKKPVAAVVGTMAASGGYIAALGADRIVARGNSLVGSIGVLFQYPNVAKLLDTVGVKMEEIKSSPLKAAPNGFEPTSPEARAAMAALVEDSFAWFKALVRDRRHMSDAELAAVADGRVFTGRQGVPLKLIDGLGGEREAIAWLETQKGVTKDLPVRDQKPDGRLERLGLLSLLAQATQALGYDGAARALQHAADAGEVRLLDGLVSVWQGPAAP